MENNNAIGSKFDDWLKEENIDIQKCSRCGCVIAEDDTLWIDASENLYCEECWIQYEAELKRLI